MKAFDFFHQLDFTWRSPLRTKEPSLRPKSSSLDLDQEMSFWCQQKAREFQLEQIAEIVSVHWNSRMRSSAGRAWWPHGKIELNPKLREISEEEVWRTLKHELAHLFAYQRHGRRISPHGIEWREACADLGIPDEKARHTLALKPRKISKKHAYQCPICRVIILRVRPLNRKVACYECCKKENGAKFHEKFQLLKIPFPNNF